MNITKEFPTIATKATSKMNTPIDTCKTYGNSGNCLQYG